MFDMPTDHPVDTPRPAEIRRWRRYLAEERAEAAVYTQLAARRQGEEREVLLALAQAEGRHAAHREQLLGERAGRPRKPALRSRKIGRAACRERGVNRQGAVRARETNAP